MRVLFLSSVSILGGAERMLVTMLRSLQGLAETHVAMPGEGPLVDEVRRAGAQVHAIEMGSLAQLGESDLVRGVRAFDVVGRLGRAVPAAARGAIDVARVVAHTAPDLVHSNGLKTHVLSAFAVRPAVPIVWHLHDFISTRALTGRVFRLGARRVAHAIANSEAVAADARRVVPGLPVAVIENAIDLATFAPGPAGPAEEGELLDREAGLPSAPPGTVRVALVATYGIWKGHDVFLRAAARVVRAVEVPVRFYVVGGPVYATAGSQVTRASLEQMARELGIAEVVGFVAFQREAAPVYRAADVVVHASTKPEPFGLTIAEAMACGRAVIVSQAGGAASLFTHDVDGLGVAPGDDAALACAMVRLVGDAAARQRLGERARVTALRRYDATRIGPALMERYAELTARGRAA